MPMPKERPKSSLLGLRKSGKPDRLTRALLVMITVVIVVGLTSTYFSLAGLLTKTSVASHGKVSLRKTYETPKNSDDKDEKPKIHAVIHMGPHKTGTTAIQVAADEHVEALAEDGYEMPLNSMNGNFAHSFASCFRPLMELVSHPCRVNLLLSGLDIAQKNRNLFVSAEALDGSNEQGLYELASYLSRWDKVTIVVYYRRYYAWLASFYNQMQKHHGLERSQKSIIKYITEHTKKIPAGYVVPLVARLQKEFPNIVVMNYHNKSMGGSVESLFCHAMKDASSMCSAIRADASSKTQENVGVNLDYMRLAVGARDAGLIRIDSNEELERFARAAEARREETSNSTGGEFKKRCPPASVLDSLWNQSLAFETSLFPQQVESPGDDLKSDFEKYATSKLCEVDVESVLGEEQWKSFFQQLGEEQAASEKKKEAAAEKNSEEEAATKKEEEEG